MFSLSLVICGPIPDVGDVQAHPVPGFGDDFADVAASRLEGGGPTALSQPVRAAAAHPKLPD